MIVETDGEHNTKTTEEIDQDTPCFDKANTRISQKRTSSLGSLADQNILETDEVDDHPPIVEIPHLNSNRAYKIRANNPYQSSKKDRPTLENMKKLQNFVTLTGGSKDCIGYRKAKGASLNIGSRISNIKKIVKENANTYDRLIRVKSTMEASKLKQVHQNHLKLKKMI